MKRFVPIALVVVGVVFLIRRFVGGEGTDWEARLAKLPEDSPPRWMFGNISAIRENTEELLRRVNALEPR